MRFILLLVISTFLLACGKSSLEPEADQSNEDHILQNYPAEPKELADGFTLRLPEDPSSRLMIGYKDGEFKGNGSTWAIDDLVNYAQTQSELEGWHLITIVMSEDTEDMKAKVDMIELRVERVSPNIDVKRILMIKQE